MANLLKLIDSLKTASNSPRDVLNIISELDNNTIAIIIDKSPSNLEQNPEAITIWRLLAKTITNIILRENENWSDGGSELFSFMKSSLFAPIFNHEMQVMEKEYSGNFHEFFWIKLSGDEDLLPQSYLQRLDSIYKVYYADKELFSYCPDLNSYTEKYKNYIEYSDVTYTGNVMDFIKSNLSSQKYLENRPDNERNTIEDVPTPKEPPPLPSFDKDLYYQAMIMGKLSNYIIFKKENFDLIPKIKNGMCSHLSYLFGKSTMDQWGSFINTIREWDGSEATLESSGVEPLFNELVQLIKSKAANKDKYLVYISERTLIDVLSSIEQPLQIVNPWHQICIKKSTEDNCFYFYDPNFKTGVKKLETAQEVRTELAHIGPVLGCKVDHLPYIPHYTMNNPNKFMEFGGLILLRSFGMPLLNTLPPVSQLSDNALDGLMMVRTDYIPSWALISSKPQINNYVRDLVLEYRERNKDKNVKELFQKSLEELSPQQLRQNGLDKIYDANSEEAFNQEITAFFSSSKRRNLTLYQDIQNNLNTNVLPDIEKTYNDPAMLTFFYDLDHGHSSFTEKWTLKMDQEALHMYNKTTNCHFIINDQNNLITLKVINEKNETTAYPLDKAIVDKDFTKNLLSLAYKLKMMSSDPTTKHGFFHSNQPKEESRDFTPKSPGFV